MADVLMWALLIVGTMLMFNAYWLASQALFPNAVRRAGGAYSRPVAITLLGIITAGPVVGIAIAMLQAKNPGIKLVGGIVLGIPLVLGFAGSAGLAWRVGSGLRGANDDSQPWRAVLRGGPILMLTCLLPVLGWFILLPWLWVSGVGALVLGAPDAIRPRRNRRPLSRHPSSKRFPPAHDPGPSNIPSDRKHGCHGRGNRRMRQRRDVRPMALRRQRRAVPAAR
ncbi:MAG: DUF4175 domain-containing protein [Rhodobacteraceae bacterium]|nr:DUF4175 domain-containing protein [Paracoccaceae bacterium]